MNEQSTTTTSLSSPTTTTTTAATTAAIVPDILLSIAKDNRYIQQLTFLCNQVILPYLPESISLRTDNDNVTPNEMMNDAINASSHGSSPIHMIQPELSLLARMIFFGSIIFSSSLSSSSSSSSSSKSNQKNSLQGSNNSSRNNHSVGQEYLNLHFNNKNNKNKLFTYLCLVTISPYIIERIGNSNHINSINGWNDIKSFIQQWMAYIKRNVREYVFFFHSSTSISDGTNSRRNNRSRHGLNHHHHYHHHNDRLRGMERREAFEAMRRRMIERANNQQLPTSSTYTTANDNESNVVRQDPCQDPCHQPTTIQQRRQRHFSVLYFIALRRKCISFLKHIYDATNSRLQPRTPIAHTIMNTTTTTRTVNHNNNLNHDRNNNNNNHHRNNIDNDHIKVSAIIKWLIRLNMALFYANGKYPTIIHRLTGIQITKNDSLIGVPAPAPTTSAERPSYKPLCYMILLQSIAQVMKGISTMSLDYWESCQYQRQQSSSRQIHVQSEPHSFGDDNDILTRIERCVPSNNSSMASSRHCHPSTFNIHRRQAATNRHNRKIAQCGICMNDLRHPSTPIKCGHVFCWDCIQHWLVTVRSECPLCRVGTTPKDVLCLYEYSPY